MMNKTFVIAWIVLFVLWMAGSFAVHGVLLHDDYLKVPQLFRSDADSQQYMGWMLLAHVLLAGAFAWIYARGREDGKPWLGQGLRYGVAVALLTIVPTYLIYYAVQPMPGLQVAKQIAFDGMLLLMLGAAVAFTYRNSAR
jgi:hypothetical protein